MHYLHIYTHAYLQDKTTCLFAACKNGHLRTVKFLDKEGKLELIQMKRERVRSMRVFVCRHAYLPYKCVQAIDTYMYNTYICVYVCVCVCVFLPYKCVQAINTYMDDTYIYVCVCVCVCILAV